MQKYSRATRHPRVGDEQQCSATPSSVGKCEGFRQHPDTEQCGNRVEQLEFENVQRTADKISSATCSMLTV